MKHKRCIKRFIILKQKILLKTKIKRMKLKRWMKRIEMMTTFKPSSISSLYFK